MVGLKLGRVTILLLIFAWVNLGCNIENLNQVAKVQPAPVGEKQEAFMTRPAGKAELLSSPDRIVSGLTEETETDGLPQFVAAEGFESLFVEPGQAEPPARPVEARTIGVDVLYYKINPGDLAATGGVTPLEVRVEPHEKPNQLRVGFFEEEVQGTGDQWQTSGWIAVLIGAMMEGVDPTRYSFSFSSQGHIDGPSAGGLMTVAVLAGLRDETVDPEVTMTGAINPDGSIGPVSGIVHKLEGAAEAGKKLVLIPAGQSQDYDENLKTDVDVIERGQALGIEVQEVSTIFEAYQLLTGHALPQPDQSAEAPQLPEAAYAQLEAKTQSWLDRYEAARREIESKGSAEMREIMAEELESVADIAQQAEQLLAEGSPAVAYELAKQAAADLITLNEAATLVANYYTDGFDRVVEQLEVRRSLEADVKQMMALLQQKEPETINDVVTLAAAYGQIEMAEGMKIVADQLVEQTISSRHQMPNRMIVRNLGSAALYYSLAGHILESGRDSLEIGLGFGATPAPELEAIFNIAETMRRAAEANMAFFENTTVEGLAAYTGRHPDMIRQFFGEQEASYRLATAVALGIQALNPQLDEGPEAAMLILGYSQSSYGLSSGLIAKYYSLGAQFDDEFNTVSFQREEALEDMLELADQRVRALLNQLGEDAPVVAIMSYQQARHFRDGTADQQLQALSYYWRATMMAQVGSYMVQR